MHPDAPAWSDTAPELLAPAGSWESLRAAAANGADAVYFGLSRFNARARAANFTPEELPDLMRWLHRRNVRGFVALNTLVFSDELEDAQTLVRQIAEAGVDAVIVQDVGLVRLIRVVAPRLPVHASTQMTLTEPRGVRFAQQLGVSRAVLARELSAADIAKVTAAVDIPVEVFVHGALCVAYSGQCLTSEALGGRSANRGQCAQACRLPYEMVVDGKVRDLGDRAYLLSPQDLAAHDHIQPLIDAGVISFKIEGRLKGGPYVAATTQTYRKAIDAAAANTPFALSRPERRDLAQTFSRGLTPGFLEGVNHQKLVRGRTPKSRGVRLGEVVAKFRAGVRVRLFEPDADAVRAGDGVVFDLGKPQEEEPGGRVRSARVAPDGREAELVFDAQSLDLSAVPVGCEVWKTDDPELRKRLESSYSRDVPFRRTPLAAALSGELGGPLTLTLTAREVGDASASWPGPLEVAAKRPTSADEVRDAVGRLGETPFELAALEVRTPAGAMLPRSVLNDLRRRASAELEEALHARRRHPVAETDALGRLRGEVFSSPLSKVERGAGGVRLPFESNLTPQPPPPSGEGGPDKARLRVLVRNLAQLDAALAWSPPEGCPPLAGVACDFEDLRGYRDAVGKCRDAGVTVALAPLRVVKPGEEGFHSPVVRAEPDEVLVRNPGAISYFREHLPAARLAGDFGLNVANELSAGVFVGAGLVRLTPSYDLNWEQLAAMLRRSPAAWYEPVIHQHMPMFHMEHCVFAAFLSTGKDHRDCGRPCERHRVELRDRVGVAFPVHPDTGCRNTVYNSVPQSAAEYVGRMVELGVRRFRVDLLRESPDEAAARLTSYARLLAGGVDGRQLWRELRALNQLGVTRGTLQMA